MSNNKSSGFFGGVLLGAVAGAVTGLLIAPKPGRETRKLLRKSADALPDLAEDLATSVQLQADRLSDQALHNWDGTLARLKEAVSAGVEAGMAENRRLSREPASPPANPPVSRAEAIARDPLTAPESKS